jgi:hypothetical protein
MHYCDTDAAAVTERLIAEAGVIEIVRGEVYEGERTVAAIHAAMETERAEGALWVMLIIDDAQV